MREILRSGSLKTNRDEIGDALDNGIRHHCTLDCKTRDRLGPEPNSGYHAIPLCVRERRAMQGCIPKLIIHTFEVGWTGTVKFSIPTGVQQHRTQVENLC